MQAQEQLKNGDVDGALASLMQAVRDEPQNSDHRTFLFQLLAINGAWDRALNQLVVASEMNSAAIPMMQTYREALSCEALRAQVFQGSRSPLVFGEPENWIALVLESLKRCGEGQVEEAAKLREQAFEDAPTSAGKVNGEAFEWIADGDSRIGPFFEAVVNGSYYWVPMHRVAKLELEPPEDLRDLIWIPAQFSWVNGGQAIALVPTRYPGSEASEDGAIRLSRRTEWQDLGGDTFAGLGQRELITDGGEYPLLEIREIDFDVEVEADTDADTAPE